MVVWLILGFAFAVLGIAYLYSCKDYYLEQEGFVASLLSFFCPKSDESEGSEEPVRQQRTSFVSTDTICTCEAPVAQNPFGPLQTKELDSYMIGDEIICNRVLYSKNAEGGLEAIAYISKVVEEYLAEDETRNEFLKHLGTDDTTVAKIEPVIMNYEVVSIGESAFSMIQGLQEIVIPDTVTEIGDSAFSGCVDLKTIRLGSGIQNIGVGVFDDCKCLESVYFDGDTLPVCEDSTKLQKCILRVPEKSFCSIIASPFGQQFKQITDGRYVKSGLWTFRYLQDRKKVEIVKFDGRDSEIEIPSSVILEGLGVVVAGIGKNAFRDNQRLVNVKFSSRLTFISDHAFEGCSSLHKIDVPDNVARIGAGAFCGCENAVELRLPENLTTLKVATFKKCKALRKITLPLNLQRLEDDAFSLCSSINAIDFPPTVTEIGIRTFSQCVALTDVQLPENLQKLGNAAFGDCINMEHICFPNGFSKLHKAEMIDAIQGCEKLNVTELLKNNN